MQKKADAEELHRRVYDIVRGGSNHSAGIFGPFGMNRGLREELLKEVGIVSGKIAKSGLSDDEVNQFFALCQISNAHGIMSESDIDMINEILVRNS